MKKIIRLTESDLTRIVKRVLSEQPEEYSEPLQCYKMSFGALEMEIKLPKTCEQFVKTQDENFFKACVTQSKLLFPDLDNYNATEKVKTFFECVNHEDPYDGYIEDNDD